MGNKNFTPKQVEEVYNCSRIHNQPRSRKHLKVSSISDFSFTDFVANCSIHSFGSLRSQHSRTSSCSVNRPWSRVSRRQWNERTLNSPLEASKTAWPVPFTESLFLPTFRIRDDVTEESFFVDNSISTGAFGFVYKVYKKDTGDVYAMKVLSKAQIIAGGAVQQVKDEVRIQQACGHHPLVVNCPFFWQSRKQLFIISEYVPGGELLRLLQISGPLPEDIVRIYVAQLAVAIDFLHNAGVIYRDLKLENILLDSQGRIQLVDFGLAKWLKYGARTRTLCGTLQYIAPEVLLREPYGHAADWWSLGIVVLCMLLNQMPYSCCLDDEKQVRPMPDVSCSPQAKDLLHRLLQPDPLQRLRSRLAIERIAFFKDFSLSAAVNMSVNLPKKEISSISVDI